MLLTVDRSDEGYCQDRHKSHVPVSSGSSTVVLEAGPEATTQIMPYMLRQHDVLYVSVRPYLACVDIADYLSKFVRTVNLE